VKSIKMKPISDEFSALNFVAHYSWKCPLFWCFSNDSTLQKSLLRPIFISFCHYCRFFHICASDVAISAGSLGGL